MDHVKEVVNIVSKTIKIFALLKRHVTVEQLYEFDQVYGDPDKNGFEDHSVIIKQGLKYQDWLVVVYCTSLKGREELLVHEFVKHALKSWH
jgi:hypothetical protein